jgi:hypothetical protein
MSRSKNLKRAKALHQKKVLNRKGIKNSKHHSDQVALHEEDFTDKRIIIDRALICSEYKVSSLVMEMVQPLLDDANDLEELRNILLLAIVAWNYGILRDQGGEASLDKEFNKIKPGEQLFERKLLDKYIDIKCAKYKAYDEYIIGYKLTENEGKAKFTVTTAANDKSIDAFLNQNYFPDITVVKE